MHYKKIHYNVNIAHFQINTQKFTKEKQNLVRPFRHCL